MITIVSGLPRSGTSMMMQMLAAGGIPILTDDKRQPDQDNPRGYFEWEKVTRLCAEPEIIAEAEGKAVKVISRLLNCLPTTHEYKIIFMLRASRELIDSQELMAQHRGITTLNRPAFEAAVGHAFAVHLREVGEWWMTQPTSTEWMSVEYLDTVQHPKGIAWTIRDFISQPQLDLDRMAAAVDPSLYRNRSDVTSVIR